MKITNLSDRIREADLSEIFSEYSLSSCTLNHNIAVLDFRDPSDAQRAVSQFNLTDLGMLLPFLLCKINVR